MFQSVSERPTPPLPYRIAKALDPVLYRNVELDIVQEEKRGEPQTGRAAWGRSFRPSSSLSLSVSLLPFPSVVVSTPVCL